MAEPGIRVEGDADLARSLDDVADSLDNLDPATRATALDALDRIRPHVPVEDGDLLATGRVEHDGTRAAVEFGGSTVDYAQVVNYGSPRLGITGAEFMAKGDQEADAAVRRIEDHITSQIRREGLNR